MTGKYTFDDWISGSINEDYLNGKIPELSDENISPGKLPEKLNSISQNKENPTYLVKSEYRIITDYQKNAFEKAVCLRAKKDLRLFKKALYLKKREEVEESIQEEIKLTNEKISQFDLGVRIKVNHEKKIFNGLTYKKARYILNELNNDFDSYESKDFAPLLLWDHTKGEFNEVYNLYYNREYKRLLRTLLKNKEYLGEHEDPSAKLSKEVKSKIKRIASDIHNDGRSNYKFDEVYKYLCVFKAFPALKTSNDRKEHAKKLLSDEAAKRLDKAKPNTLSSSWQKKLNKVL